MPSAPPPRLAGPDRQQQAAAAPLFAQLLHQADTDGAGVEICPDRKVAGLEVAAFRQRQRERIEAIEAAATTLGEGELRLVRLGRTPVVATRQLEVKAMRVQADALRFMHRGKPVKVWPIDKAEQAAAALRAVMKSRHAVGPREKVAIVRTIGGREVVEVVEGDLEAVRRNLPDAITVETWRQAGVHVPRQVAGLVAGQRHPRPVTG